MLTILCIACYFKGRAFMQACKERGARVLLLTAKSLENENWPRESIDGIYFMEEPDENWNTRNLVTGVSHLASQEKIDRIVALDDFDLEKAALLREHLRVPGMGDTRTRFFRDKLSMRMKARELGLRVPDFVHCLHYPDIKAFCSSIKPPWIIKPRMQASAVGIEKIHSEEQLWQKLKKLGDQQSFYLLEQFIPGNIYHVDSLIDDRKVIFARVNRYLSTPMEVMHDGGIFRTHTVLAGSADDVELQRLNQELLSGFRLIRGVSHTEFIQSHDDGSFHFLETSARVGGANIAEMVEASSGINLWREWAHLETLALGEAYVLPEIRQDYSGLITTLAKQEHPDLSGYSNPEIYRNMSHKHHASLIVKSDRYDQVLELLDNYRDRFHHDFHTRLPAPDKPTS